MQFKSQIQRCRKVEVPNVSFKDFLVNQVEPSREDANYVAFWTKHINYCKSGVMSEVYMSLAGYIGI